MTRRRIIACISVATALLMVMASFAMAVGSEGTGDEKVKVIVLFKDEVDEKLIKNKGGEIDHKFTLIPAVVTHLKQKDIDALKEDSRVEAVEPDATATIAAPGGKPGKPDKPDKPGKQEAKQSLPWGVDRIDAEEVWESNSGSGIDVAVLDTGIDTDHPDLTVAGGINFVAIGGSVDPTKYEDDHGHGTHCAGIIAAQNNKLGVVGVAPQANLYAVKVLNSGGSGTYEAIIDGIEWAVGTQQVDVISMSFRGPHNSALETACAAACAAGIVLVAASGNDYATSLPAPAMYSSVIAVGATARNNRLASWSNTGTGLELVAPGVRIESTWNDGDYKSESGTSMACPHVAGTAALVLVSNIPTAYDDDGDGVWDPIDVLLCLRDTADNPWDASLPNTKYGYGLVDAEEAATGSETGDN